MNPSTTLNMKVPRPCHPVKKVSFGSFTKKLDLLVPLSGECLEILSKTNLNLMDLTPMVIKEIFKNSIVEK